MTEKQMKPIIFSTKMVKAILAGRKTQTRRVMKPQPEFSQYYEYKGRLLYEGEARIWCWKSYVADSSWDEVDCLNKVAPYQPGDILYVRETWRKISMSLPMYEYKASCDFDSAMPWKPSIHMPRAAARIFLRVTDVRVERLWDISPEGVMAEGGFHNLSQFKDLWDSLNAKRDYGWDTNPWVWAIEFERTDDNATN